MVNTIMISGLMSAKITVNYSSLTNNSNVCTERSINSLDIVKGGTIRMALPPAALLRTLI